MIGEPREIDEMTQQSLDDHLAMRRRFSNLIGTVPGETEMDGNAQSELDRMRASQDGSTSWDRVGALAVRFRITQVRRGFESVAARVLEAIEAKMGMESDGPLGTRIRRAEDVWTQARHLVKAQGASPRVDGFEPTIETMIEAVEAVFGLSPEGSLIDRLNRIAG
jgi:hypothetical protein